MQAAMHKINKRPTQGCW